MSPARPTRLVPWRVAILGGAGATAIVVALGLLGPGSARREVIVPSLLTLPAPEAQATLLRADLVAAPVVLGWESTAPPAGSVGSQVPRAGTLVAAGSDVRVGLYLGATGGLSPAPWPARVQGRLQVKGSYSDPARIGTRVTAADLRVGPLTSRSFVGPDGFALSVLDGFTYPVATTDGGATWRVAGTWFAGPWADAAAFPSTIRAYSEDVAVAFFPGESVVYATLDGGARWFNAYLPGNVVSVSVATRPGSPAASTITVRVTNWDGARKTATYRSATGGRTWSLVAHGGVSGTAAVPDLLGMTVAQASSALLALGFVPTVDHLYVAGSSPQVVQSQMPLGGATMQRGSTVAIAVPH